MIAFPFILSQQNKEYHFTIPTNNIPENMQKTAV